MCNKEFEQKMSSSPIFAHTGVKTRGLNYREEGRKDKIFGDVVYYLTKETAKRQKGSP